MTLTEYNGLRVTIFGAGGFVGRWAGRLLSSLGAELTLIVRDRHAAEAVFQTYNVRGKIYTVDLSKKGSATAPVLDSAPDLVVNLAGYGVDSQERDPFLAHRINTDLVAEIAHACLKLPSSRCPGLRLIHAGSALEYGEIEGAASEDRVPNPTTLYGTTKLAATRALESLARSHQLPAFTARLFQVVGPGEHKGRLLPLLLEAAQSPDSGPIPLTHGRQLLDFTYVEDVAEGLLRLALCTLAREYKKGSSRPGMVINLGTGQTRSVRQFAEVAASVLGLSSSRLLFNTLPVMHQSMHFRQVPVDRLIRLVGWRPDGRIEEMIRRTREFS